MSATFLSLLPSRPEAILKGVATGYNTGSALVRTACSSLEAPSAVRSALLLTPNLEILFNETPEPDPRVPFEPVKVQLWDYDGHVAAPALPEPPQAVLETVAEGISREFDLDRWGISAREAVKELPQVAPCELLAAMLFTGPCPRDVWPWDWLFRAQVYTALLLAGIESPDWIQSTSAAHLIDVVHGPVDWTTTAALVGLTHRARHDANCAPEVIRLFLRLLKRPMTPIWYMCAYKPAVQLLQHIPCIPADLAAAVTARVHVLESEDED